LKQLERRPAARFVVYGQHIEAALARGWHLAKKVAGNEAEFSFLVSINGGFGGLYVARCSRLDLDKTESVLVPSDEIEFTAMVWGPVVASDDDIALSPQVEVGIFLAATARTLVRRQVVGR
jgi:hypothetical protein